MKRDPLAKMHRQEQKEDFLRRTFSEYLACHPTYTIPLIRAHNFIMRENGPINPTIRYYIAIMAAARHRCSFLINFLKKQFILQGGNPDWMKGLEHVPAKLQLLDKINRTLAHQPWTLKAKDIQTLTKNINRWSLPEITQAMIILAHFHSLCSLAFGCKFGFEAPKQFSVDEQDYEEVEIEELRIDSSGPNRIRKVIKRLPASKLIVERCKRLEDEELTDLITAFCFRNEDSSKPKPESYFECLKPENLKKLEEEDYEDDDDDEDDDTNNGENSSKDVSSASESSSSAATAAAAPPPGPEQSTSSSSSLPSSSSASTSTTTATAPQASTSKKVTQPSTSSSSGGGKPIKKEPIFKPNSWSMEEWQRNNYEVLLEEPEFCYVDFAKREETTDVSTYRIQDYQWDDQGYSLANYLYPDIGSYLDEKFKVGHNLTYYTLGPKTNVDTSPFRRAVWNYIQSIYGIRHDDYNYREVNILLERNLKAYIKILACFPEQSPNFNCNLVMQGFRESEKIHVKIMVSEARLQAEILYAMRALMNYLKISG